ncbi:hypothetical protein SAMN04487772_10688 [[Clostridium] polysaccharolyticum]|uniref:Uncharacterized protein n=1 Tax=[Clostridium] polysaccharolyticum TaxID=29364 RepID=A0A1I0AY11_9FIRM|nr:hypothetical protein SAMN04487772_10688 [[Clostridium] polysaccharolyticum]
MGKLWYAIELNSKKAYVKILILCIRFLNKNCYWPTQSISYI